jgi:hypothetical protein
MSDRREAPAVFGGTFFPMIRPFPINARIANIPGTHVLESGAGHKKRNPGHPRTTENGAVLLEGLMRSILIVLALCGLATAGKRQDDFNRAMNDFGETMHQLGKEEGERKRQARLDSINRVTDSLENEMRTTELEMKRMKLEEMRRQAREDSIRRRRAELDDSLASTK